MSWGEEGVGNACEHDCAGATNAATQLAKRVAAVKGVFGNDRRNEH